MKKRAAAVTFLTLVIASMGVPIVEFHGWPILVESSREIIIAKCLKTPDPFHTKTNGLFIDPRDGLIESHIQIALVLKGASNGSAEAILTSQFWPRQGEYYLVFAQFDGGKYWAVEPYKVVPLGTDARTNSLTSNILYENVRSLLKIRLDNLNRQTKEEQEEKQRLEEALPPTNPAPSGHK